MSRKKKKAMENTAMATTAAQNLCGKCGHPLHLGRPICPYGACVCQFGALAKMGDSGAVEAQAPAYTGRPLSELMSPELRAQFTGVAIGALPASTQAKPTQFYLYADGLWCQYTLPMGVLTVQQAQWKNDRLPKKPHAIEAGFELTTPLIHADLLLQIVAFFKAVNTKYKSEAYVSVFWDGTQYHVEVPQQTISGGHVGHQQQRDFPGEIEALQIHSHDTMGAFFSGTDDADEQKHGQRVYGVFGKLNQAVPESKWRVLAGGVFHEINLSDIVEWPDFVVEHSINGSQLFPQAGSQRGITLQPVEWDPCAGVTFPDLWMERVREPVVEVSVSSYQGWQGSGYVWHGHQSWHDIAQEHLETVQPMAQSTPAETPPDKSKWGWFNHKRLGD